MRNEMWRVFNAVSRAIKDVPAVKERLRMWSEQLRMIKYFGITGIGFGIGTLLLWSKFHEEHVGIFKSPNDKHLSSMQLKKEKKKLSQESQPPNGSISEPNPLPSSPNASNTSEETMLNKATTPKIEKSQNLPLPSHSHNYEHTLPREKTGTKEDNGMSANKTPEKKEPGYRRRRSTTATVDSEDDTDQEGSYVRPPRPRPKKGKKWKNSTWIDDE